MAIATAIQMGESVSVYGETGKRKFSKTGTLHGYTSDFVSIRVEEMIHVYGENGTRKFSKSTVLSPD
jgi:hypothetical protein